MPQTRHKLYTNGVDGKIMLWIRSPPLKHIADVADEGTRSRRHINPFAIEENLQSRYFILLGNARGTKQSKFFL